MVSSSSLANREPSMSLLWSNRNWSITIRWIYNQIIYHKFSMDFTRHRSDNVFWSSSILSNFSWIWSSFESPSTCEFSVWSKVKELSCILSMSQHIFSTPSIAAFTFDGASVDSDNWRMRKKETCLRSTKDKQRFMTIVKLGNWNTYWFFNLISFIFKLFVELTNFAKILQVRTQKCVEFLDNFFLYVHHCYRDSLVS